MALVKGEDSYVTVVEADAYFDSRLFATAWQALSNADKERALKTATRSIEKLEFEGRIADASQKLAFPRTGSYYEPKYGYMTEFDPLVVPTEIVEAVCEAAIYLASNSSAVNAGVSVEEFTLDVISLKGIGKTSATAPATFSALKKFVVGGYGGPGGGLWWRSN